jgi:hypoxanthine phosphoribosyltransferase
MSDLGSQLRVLKSEADIQTRVTEMGKELSKKFKGSEPLAICVLNSSFMFFADLIRAIDLDIECEFLAVSSYGNKKISSGEVKVILDLDMPIEGKDVLLVEDMVDTGLTMNYLIETLKARKPKSLTTVVLLQKTECLKVPCKVDMIGFEVGNDFIVGYGIDCAGEYRNLPYLAVVPN